ncbi:MAG: D-alanyl-D-alanine carboxypeptidase/endopeptidase, family [Bacteroidetes bacterium]|nr:D-alanyl-D-alanine carboxypeptidase/endopeptidase, family [Bacteroidota bacterium]
MKTPALLFLAAVLTSGCAQTSRITETPHVSRGPALTSTSDYESMKTAIDTLFADSLFPPSFAGIKVVHLRTGKLLYSLNPDHLFNPASNEKLFTAATALKTIGPGALLSTVVTADSSARTIGLKGMGDPLLSTADLESLATLTAVALPKDRSWLLRNDASYFDDMQWGDGWTWDGEPESYAMFVTPLMLNSNAIEVRVRAASAGQPPEVTLDPPTTLLGIENSAVSVIPRDSIRTRLEISRRWRERSNTITVAGEIPVGRTRSTSLSLWKPDLFATQLFAEMLRSRGVKVDTAWVDTVAVPGVEVARVSHTLDSAVTYMNKVSDNLAAEALLKGSAAVRWGGRGSANRGIDILKEILTEAGIDTLSMRAVDGSGLSRYDLTTASALSALLVAMHRDSALFPVFYTSLPIAGVDGTIERRMRGTPAERNLRAKTGTLNGVTALSGYVRTADDEMLAFSMLMQNFLSGTTAYRNVQDRIGALLAGMKLREVMEDP